MIWVIASLEGETRSMVSRAAGPQLGHQLVAGPHVGGVDLHAAGILERLGEEGVGVALPHHEVELAADRLGAELAQVGLRVRAGVAGRRDGDLLGGAAGRRCRPSRRRHRRSRSARRMTASTAARAVRGRACIAGDLVRAWARCVAWNCGVTYTSGNGCANRARASCPRQLAFAGAAKLGVHPPAPPESHDGARHRSQDRDPRAQEPGPARPPAKAVPRGVPAT